MQMNLPFKPLMIAALMASAFTLSSQAMAGATLMDVTIDGDHLGKQTGAAVEVGTDESNNVLIKASSGSPAFVNKGNSITVKGKEIRLEGKVSEYGLDVFVYNNKGGIANIGNENTNQLTIFAQHAALRNQSSEITLDAKNINLYMTFGERGYGAVEINDEQDCADSTTVIGKHADTIAITANQLEKSKIAYDGSAVRIRNGGSLTLGSESTKDVSLTSNFKGSSFGLYAESPRNAIKVDIHGESIKITSKGDETSAGVFANSNSTLNIGDANKSNIEIKSTNSVTTGDDAYSFGVWVSNVDSYGKPSGAVNLSGNSVDIRAEGVGDVYGIFVASNNLDPVTNASLTINANKINVEAVSKDENKASVGIVGMSAGKVTLIGDTTIKADQAILARGDADIEINKDGKHSTQIMGDVVFDYDKPTSGTAVNANIDITLSGANSSWTGNTAVQWNGLPEEGNTSDKLTVTDMKLTVKDGAQWNPTMINSTDSTAPHGQKSVALNNLSLDNGIVNITDNTIHVNVDKMSGNGTVKLATDLTQEEGKQAGTFTVGKAEPNAALTIKLTNTDMSKELTADEVKAEQAKKLLGNVIAKDVDKQVVVDEGMYNGAFSVTNNGSTINHGPNSVMQSTLELATVTPLALNRILTNDVHKRMGDIRSMNGTSGAWARYDGGSLSSQSGLDNDFHTIQVGIDTVPTLDAPRFGVAFSYTKSDADYKRGSADMDVYSLAAYGLWMNDNGQFVDVVARLGSAKTDMTVDGDKKGSMDNIVTALSGEFGWRFNLVKSVYIEPQVELAYTHVDADDLSLSNGSTYRFDNANSLMGRAGFALGLQCPENGNTVYLRMSAVHEFLGDNAVTGGNGTVYEVDGKDTWVEYGLGANFNLTKSTYVWADVERTSGGALDEDWRATLGVRYAF